jgi:hypothetical protein
MLASHLPIVKFFVMVSVTLTFVFFRADDVADKLDARPGVRPAGNDALLRIGYVISKMIGAVYGGSLLSHFFFYATAQMLPAAGMQLIRHILPIFFIISFLVAMVIAYALIGSLQNALRYAQGRPSRRFLTADNMRRIAARWTTLTSWQAKKP